MASRNGLKFFPRKLSDLNEMFSPTKPFYRSFQKSSKLGKFLDFVFQLVFNFFLKSRNR